MGKNLGADALNFEEDTIRKSLTYDDRFLHGGCPSGSVSIESLQAGGPGESWSPGTPLNLEVDKKI